MTQGPIETPRYASIRSTLLGAILDRIIARGFSITPLLSKHGISLDILKDPYSQLSMNEYVAFLESAAEFSGDEHIGARIGADMRAGDLGPTGILLSLSRSIYVGLERLSRSAQALQTDTETSIYDDEDEVSWSYRLLDSRIENRRQDAEFSICAVVQVIRNNFTQRWTPLEVHFEHEPPQDTRFLEKFFRCPVIYGQATNRVILERAPLLALYRAEDDALIMALERHISDLIAATPNQSTLSGAVVGIVSSSLGLRPVNVERVSDALGLSPRNLQRKLGEEGTSLRAILDDIRRERAHVMLTEQNMPVGEVARALGYSDGTAFWRAQKRWSEASPRDARQAATG
jgi:AraC-like DNA-binding protein